MRFRLLLIILVVAAASCSRKPVQFTEYVNPFIGTGGHGHTYPGAAVPFGMVQLSPDTRLTGWDGCSAYHYSDDVVYGFSHTHLSGTGCSDYGDILLMPFTGEPTPFNGAEAGHEKGYASKFSHQKETASPGLLLNVLVFMNIISRPMKRQEYLLTCSTVIKYLMHF